MISKVWMRFDRVGGSGISGAESAPAGNWQRNSGTCLGLAQSAYKYHPIIDNIASNPYIGAGAALARGSIADRGEEDRVLQTAGRPRAIPHDRRLIGWRHRRKLAAISGEDT